MEVDYVSHLSFIFGYCFISEGDAVGRRDLASPGYLPACQNLKKPIQIWREHVQKLHTCRNLSPGLNCRPWSCKVARPTVIVWKYFYYECINVHLAFIGFLPLKNLMMSVKSMLFSKMISLYNSTSASAINRTKWPEEMVRAAQMVSHTENTSSYTIS